MSLDEDDAAVLGRVVDFYHACLKRTPAALAYLEKRGIADPAAIETFKLGFADRTLGLRLPDKRKREGAALRARLERLGLFRESGHEHFCGSLVIPVLDEAGLVAGMYGRKITEGLRAGTPLHLYLPGPHRGVWNLPGIAAGEGTVILCEALIDALSFWCAGFCNVTAPTGWTVLPMRTWPPSARMACAMCWLRTTTMRRATGALRNWPSGWARRGSGAGGCCSQKGWMRMPTR
jgi:DNA primase